MRSGVLDTGLRIQPAACCHMPAATRQSSVFFPGNSYLDENFSTMKRFLFSVVCILCVITGGAQSLPRHPDTLRVLAIGNSFSDDGTQYLPSLLESAGIRNVILGRLYIGGCSLERHCREYADGSSAYRYDKSTANVWRTVSEHATLPDGLRDEPWDVVTMQETSGYSGIYDNIRTWLPVLIGIVRKEVPNPDAAIVWHGTWAYAVNSDHERFPLYDRNQEKMYSGIQDCISRLQEDFGIGVVIPCGKAVQLARSTRLNNIGKVPPESKVYDLTRDGYHLNRQFGRYLAACTWFEALMNPVFGISVKGNGCLLEDTEHRIPRRDARLCQKIAAGTCR